MAGRYHKDLLTVKNLSIPKDNKIQEVDLDIELYYKCDDDNFPFESSSIIEGTDNSLSNYLNAIFSEDYEYSADDLDILLNLWVDEHFEEIMNEHGIVIDVILMRRLRV